MKIFFYAMVFFTISCKTINIDTVNINEYQDKALDFIVLSDYSKSHSVKKNDIRVSEELIPFHDIGNFFLDSLLTNGFSKSEFGNLRNYNFGVDETLKKLTTNKKSNIHLFFSNEIKEFFFVELIIDDRKLIKYEEATEAGSSIGYMFKKHGNSVILMGSIKIYHG